MSSLKQFVTQHPRLTAWLVLAVGMVAILVWSARDVGLLAGQWAALIVATIGLAGLCVWIIGWEDEEEEASDREKSEGAEAGPTE
jgi:protein-S-isoprenylcysteine O-methyltransferase Ste14